MAEQAVGGPEAKGPFIHYPRHHDDEWVDEIHITTRPRFKQSELSGDEWRTSAVVEIRRKGETMRIRSYHNIEYALRYLGSIVGFAPADYEPSEPGGDADLGRDKCFQPGCANPATVEVRKIAEADSRGHVDSLTKWENTQYRVKWCDAHKHRGDASLDDADTNYEAVSP